MNERIARRGNEEDHCTGRFWEGRFHSQALLDETALLQCMTYVDLNPIRAGMAETPEESEYTSVKHRLDRQKENRPDQLMAFLEPKQKPTPDPITDFTKKAVPDESHEVIPITFREYLDLLDWTGRIIREDKTGAISKSAPDILTRLGFNQNQWKTRLTTSTQWRLKALGPTHLINDFAKSIGQSWIWKRPVAPDS